MSWFWQKTQRRLQPEKKIVPEPRRPRRQSSSPKCGKYEATTAWRPIAQRPATSARRSTLQPRGQTTQRGPSSSNASAARRSSSPDRAGSPCTPVAALAGAITLGFLLEGAGSAVGALLRGGLRLEPLRALDSLGG